MAEWSVLEMIRWGGFAGVAVGVVVIFFVSGEARDRVAWLTTTLFYVAVLSTFADLFLTVWNGSAPWTERFPRARVPLLVSFGFLAFMFGAGSLVSTFKTIGRLRGRSTSGADVVH